MTDHRRLQRALFRMQMDEGFSGRIFAGDLEASSSTKLDEADLLLLRSLDPKAVAADAKDQRKQQLLGNIASEFTLSTVSGPDDLLALFLTSAPFHEAIASDEPLVLAFGDFVLSHAVEDERQGDVQLIELELAMARLRRKDRASTAAVGTLALSPRADLVQLVDGTLGHAAALRESLEQRTPHPDPNTGHGTETVLLVADECNPHQLPDVKTERLEPAVEALLVRAREGLDQTAREALASELGTTLDELSAFAASLVEEGVLIAG